MDGFRTPKAPVTPSADPGTGRTPGTLKDVESEVERLGKENFNLKLKIFFLEEKLYKSLPDNFEQTLQENIELKMELAGKKQELDEKNQLLVKARNAIESLQADLELARMQRLTEKQRSKLEEMPRTISGLEIKIRSLEEELDRARRSATEATDVTASQVADIQRQLSREQESARSLEKALRSAEKDMAELRREREESRLVISQKEREVSNLREQKQSLEDDLNRVRSEAKTMASHLQNEKEEVARLRNSLQSAEISMRDAANEIQKAALERTSLETKMQTLSDKLAAEQDARQRVSRQTEELKSRLTGEEDETKHLQEQLQLQSELVDQLQKQLSQKSKLLTQSLEACRASEESKKTVQDKAMTLHKQLQDVEAELRASKIQMDALQTDWITREQELRQGLLNKEETLNKEWVSRHEALESKWQARLEQLMQDWRLKEMEWNTRLGNQQRLLQASLAEQENSLQAQLIDAQAREQEQAARIHQLQMQLQKAASANLEAADKDTTLALKEQDIQRLLSENASLNRKIQQQTRLEDEVESTRMLNGEMQALRDNLSKLLAAVFNSALSSESSSLENMNWARMSVANLSKEVQQALDFVRRLQEQQAEGLRRATKAEDEARTSARIADTLRVQAMQSAERERILNEQLESLQEQLATESRLRANISLATSLGGPNKTSAHDEHVTGESQTHKNLEESNRLLLSELQLAREKYHRCREKLSCEKEDLLNRLREKEALLSKHLSLKLGKEYGVGVSSEKHDSPALALTKRKNKVEVVFLRQINPSREDMMKAKQLLEKTGHSVSRELLRKSCEYP